MADELDKREGQTHSIESQTRGIKGESAADQWPKRFVQALERQIENLEADKEHLQGWVDQLLQQLQDKDEQLRALMPGRGSDKAEASGNERREGMSRWEHFKAAVFGG